MVTSASCQGARAIALGASVVLVLLASPARADEADARAHFELGRKLAREGHCEAALQELRLSLAAQRSVGALLNSGDCEERLGHLVAARAHFADAELLARDDQERRDEAHARTLKLDARIPALTVNADDGIALDVDGEPVTAGAAKAVDPGHHIVHAATRGQSARAFEIDVREATREVFQVPAAQDAAPPRPAHAEGGDTLRTVAWIGLAAGGASLVAGTIFGVEAIGHKNDLVTACPLYPRCSVAMEGKARDLDDALQRDGLISTVTLVAGGALVGAGAVLLLVTPRQTQVGVRLAPKAGGLGAIVEGAF